MRLPPQPRTSSSYSSKQRGGQILVGPADGYLYLVLGHGEDEAADKIMPSPGPGKIIRFDVDGSTPNPEVIVAKGLGNPRGCSFDSGRPFDLYCANVDQVELALNFNLLLQLCMESLI